jgi:TolB-like protein/DNA-binding SARP family transcriptional activator/Tfp pilus assembly protein PilF
MAAVHLRLLGSFEAASAAGDLLPIAGKRPRALLAYLAMPPGRRRSRAELAALLWGREDEQRARHSVSEVLTRLRRWLDAAGPDLLLATRDDVMLDPGRIRVDAVELEALSPDGPPAALAEIVSLYRGDFLEGIDLAEEAFEDWLLARRYELRQAAMRLLGTLARAGDPEPALAAARRLATLSPLDEWAHRRVMALQLEAGRADLAVVQFERCREVIRRELGTEPEPATRQLHREALAAARRSPTPAPRPPEAAAPAPPWDMSAPGLPDRTSIAVLPFENRSGDPGQDFLAEGITEEIITALARFRNLFVIARNSSFAYRDGAAAPERIGRELGVRYLLRGRVRRIDGTLRVSARITDTGTGEEVWADHYDRSADNLLALQDEVAATIVATLVGRVENAELQRIRRKPPASLAAYELVLRGRALMQRHRPGDEDQARPLLEQAVALDPQSAFARAQLALAHLYTFFWDDSRTALNRAAEIAAEAVWLDDTEAWGHMVLGLANLHLRQFDRALHHCQKAHSLNPGDPEIAAKLGLALIDVGRPDEAIPLIHRAMRLNPIEAESYCDYLGLALFTARRYEEAIQAFQVETDPKFYNHGWLGCCYAQLGRLEEARAHGARALALAPELTVERIARMEPIRDPADLEHWLSAFRLAGIP